MRSIALLSLFPLLALSSPVLNIGTIHGDAAPVILSSNAKEIPGHYIVAFKDHVQNEDAESHHAWVQDMHNTKMELKKRDQLHFGSDDFEGLKHTYNIAGSFLGYSGHFNEDVIEKIRRHPDVDYIEKDSEMHTLTEGILDESMLEKNAPWGLARISHRHALSFGTFNKYIYTPEAGEGVDVYVIDTGTNINHVDFEGRASWGKTIPADDVDVDGNGHGTHCSGIIAGNKYGVAKMANIYAVKVLRSNGSGSMSDVVKGVEYAVNEHLKNVAAVKSGKGKKGFKGSAANMSLGGGKSTLLDRAVNAAVDAGIHFAVAAGNDNADSCNYSPAAAEKAVTVGASTVADERAYFSNWGSCNDIFAPGMNIPSTWIGSNYATNTISGTSMASPHIAGLLAYFLSLQPPMDSSYAVSGVISPEQMKNNLLSIATEGVLSDIPADTKNILAWNGGGKSIYRDIMDDTNYEIPAIENEPVTIRVFDDSDPDSDPNTEGVERALRIGTVRISMNAEKLSAEAVEDFIDAEIEEFLKDFENEVRPVV